jgi:hypothetical protein
MIVLDYELSSAWNRKTGEVDLRAADEMTLRYDCFLGDVVLVVGDLDLSACWGWVPVLDFALGLRSIAGALAADDEQVFEFTESDATIEFRRKGGAVEISSSYVDGAAEVAHVDLSLLAEQFLARVVEDLGRAHSELGDNAFFAELERGLSLRA